MEANIEREGYAVGSYLGRVEGKNRGESARMSWILGNKNRTWKSRPKTRLAQQRHAENDELGRCRRVSLQLAAPIEYLFSLPSVGALLLSPPPSLFLSSLVLVHPVCEGAKGFETQSDCFPHSSTKTCCPCTVVETNIERTNAGARERGEEIQGGWKVSHCSFRL